MPIMYKRRKTSSKPKPMAVKKAKQIVRKVHKVKAKKNMDTFFYQARMSGVITPTQGATVSNYISQWFPLLSSTSPVNVTQNSEWNLWRTLYDRVRINSVTVKLIPKANVFSQGQAQDDANLTLNGQGIVYTCIDRDDQPAWNPAVITRYPSYKPYSVMKTFTRSYSIKYPSGVWLDCQNVFSDDTLLTRLGLSGGIYVYAENLVEDKSEIFNEPVYDFEVSYNCVFQGKTSGKLTFDSDTGIMTVAPIDPAQRLADSPLLVLQGSIADKVLDDTFTPQVRTDNDLAP